MNKFSKIDDVKSVRLKIIESCNWSCNFCHNEWNIKADIIDWDSELRDKLLLLEKNIWTQEVHLTGWEPSLNKNIWNIISWVKQLWMGVKMTTNWQFNEEVRNTLVNTWIDGVNFSFQSLEPAELQSVMSKNMWYDWASEQIERSKENILALYSEWIKVRINSVISNTQDILRIKWIIDWAIKNNIEMRVLDDLWNKASAKQAISTLISDTSAQLKEIITTGTSSKRWVYSIPKLWDFIVKEIDETYLSWVCETCPHYETGTCQEWFYSIRMQKNRNNNDYSIVLCIQNKNEETILSFDNFLQFYHEKKYENTITTRWNETINAKSYIPLRRV